jgi:glyoxylase-like metal-dependent hydrolase (beta-lactamase superfamily II)
MGVGDVHAVESVPDCYYVDTGMYDRAQYGTVYIYDTDRPAILDTGIGADREHIFGALDEIGIGREELEYIIPTHVHLDHAGGAGFIAAETDADVYVHETGVDFIVDPTRLWEGTKEAVGDRIRFYAEPEPVPADRVHPLEEGDTIDLGAATLDVYHAPGHAFHQAIFHDADAETVFAADAAGIYVPALDAIAETSPPPGFDLEGVIADARLIDDLNPSTICYGHFGPAPADGRIEEYIDVTERWVETIDEMRATLDVAEIAERLIERSETTAVWGERNAGEEIEMNVRGVLRYLERSDEE